MEIAGRTPEKRKRFTAPPKPYSEDTLLSAMETAGNHSFDVETEKKGLGTPATRAGIIEKLVSSGYAVQRGETASSYERRNCIDFCIARRIKISGFNSRMGE